MRKVVLSAAISLALASTSAFAADLKPVYKAPPPAAPATPAWDVAFGGVIMSDYNFRGISQSNRGPSGGGYIEPQYNLPVGTLYVGLAAWAINWPSCTISCPPGYGFTDPSAEVDFYGGWRNTWGKFTLDVGAVYYYYPKEIFNGFTNDSDFWEVYIKALYAITPDLTVGGALFYTPDLLNYSQSFSTTGGQKADALYGSLVAKWVLPWKAGDLGAFISGELGHWWIDDSGFIAAGFANASYTYYNIGLAFTYKALTLDFRYHGTDQSVTDCANFLLVAVPNNSNKWCNDTFTVAIKFDTTLNALK
jgi:uncharacterized protein (TIGR02001 family)